MRSNDYKGYSLFNDVENPALRTWNRSVVLLNINVDRGEEFVKGYIEQLNDIERMQLMAMYQYIAVKGADAVKLEISQGKHDVEVSPKVVH